MQVQDVFRFAFLTLAFLAKPACHDPAWALQVDLSIYDLAQGHNLFCRNDMMPNVG